MGYTNVERLSMKYCHTQIVYPRLLTRLNKVAKQFFDITGEKIVIHETYRTPERQKELYDMGRDKPGIQVTSTKHSLHTLGLAIDVVGDREPDKRGIQDPYAINWKLFGQLVDYAGLQWGGKWGDKVHVELKGPYSKTELFDMANNDGIIYTWLKLEEFFIASGKDNES